MDVIKSGYTRVSSILRPWNHFDGIPPEILEHKKLIGTEVHECIHLHNECIPISFEYPESEGYFESYLRWTERFGITMLDSEIRLYDDDLKITGGADALIEFPHEKSSILVDWKTSASFTKSTSLSWELQGTFYHHLLTKNDREVADRFLFVQLDSQGELPNVHEYHYSPKIFSTCLAALQTFRHFNG